MSFWMCKGDIFESKWEYFNLLESAYQLSCRCLEVHHSLCSCCTVGATRTNADVNKPKNPTSYYNTLYLRELFCYSVAEPPKKTPCSCMCMCLLHSHIWISITAAINKLILTGIAHPSVLVHVPQLRYPGRGPETRD